MRRQDGRCHAFPMRARTRVTPAPVADDIPIIRITVRFALLTAWLRRNSRSISASSSVPSREACLSACASCACMASSSATHAAARAGSSLAFNFGRWLLDERAGLDHHARCASIGTYVHSLWQMVAAQRPSSKRTRKGP